LILRQSGKAQSKGKDHDKQDDHEVSNIDHYLLDDVDQVRYLINQAQEVSESCKLSQHPNHKLHTDPFNIVFIVVIVCTFILINIPL